MAGSAGTGGTGGGGNLGAAAWVYYKEWSGGFFVVNAAAAVPTPCSIPGYTSLYNHPRFSHDGSQFAIVVSGGSDVAVWSLATDPPTLKTTLTGEAGKDTLLYPAYSVGDGPWMPGGRLFYGAADNTAGEFRIIDIATNQSFKVADVVGSVSVAWDISPDGKWVAWRDATARIATTSSPSQVTDLGNYVIEGYSPDSKRIVIREPNTGVVEVHNLAGAAPVLEWSFGAASAIDAVWASSASRLGILSTKTPGSGVYLADFDKAPLAAHQLLDADSYYNPPPTLRWSESGKLLLATVGYKASLWNAALETDVTPAQIKQDKGEKFRVSPDDRWLLWSKITDEWNLTDLTTANATTYPINGGAGVFTVDSKALINDVSTSGTVEYQYINLSGGTPTPAGTFQPPNKDLYLRTVDGVHYVFWVDNVSGVYSRLYALPIANDKVLAPRQLSSPNDFVYNGFSCLDCRPIE